MFRLLILGAYLCICVESYSMSSNFKGTTTHLEKPGKLLASSQAEQNPSIWAFHKRLSVELLKNIRWSQNTNPKCESLKTQLGLDQMESLCQAELEQFATILAENKSNSRLALEKCQKKMDEVFSKVKKV